MHAHGGLLARGRLMANAVGTAAEGHVTRIGYRVALHYRPIDIGVANDRPVHIDDRSIIGKHATAPLTSGKPDAQITAAIVHPAVVAHLGPPVALVEAIAAVGPAP